ncbi:Colicin I receptor precursor [Aliarcobacter thereius]|uniref:Colicin I receptor n=1 Tax=Aliarcobacter thereius TaxID=544718 RepID=A0A1C0B819_9BACT|nr:TonB-dependent receptor [Aliarcobacter thereius]OCL99746.1 Colicin I receptor precursor [Aliarcobacter thereius]
MKIKMAFSVASVLLAQNLVLANEATKLDSVQVVTTASGYEQKVTDAPASISVISQEDLQKKAYTNLLDAVKDIEGVDIGETRDKSGQGTVSMRGMGADYTLILIDGKKQNNNGDIYPNNFGGLQFANMPPLSMIERIEVIRGPMSTLYGADAMGGVINIITKKISNEWTGSITHSQTFQSDNEFGNDATTDVAIMGPIIKDKLGLSLRGSYYDKEASEPKDSTGSGFGGAGKTMDNQNWTAGAGLTFTPNDNHTIKANFDISKQKYDNSEGYVGTVDSYETIYKNQRVGYAPTQRMQREQYSLDWEANWDLGKSTVGVHHIKSENLGRSLPLSAEERKLIKDNKGTTWTNLNDAMNDPRFVALMPRPERTLKSENTTFNAKYELPLESHYIVFGTEFLQAKMTDGVFGMSEGKTNQSKEYYQYSAFAEDSWNIIDPLTITFGARYDNHEDFGSHFSPRVYANYNLTDNWTLKGGVATGYKTPKTSDLQEGITGFGGQGTSPWVGNPNLKPEESVNYEMAVYYEHENRHNFNITLFQNDFKDKIENATKTTAGSEWADLGYSSVNQKQNVGDATIRGIEASGKYFILDNLSIKANYTYIDSERDDTKKPLVAGGAKHMYSAVLDWQATSKLSTALRMYGEKERYRGEDYAEYWEDYQVFDLSTSYKLDNNLTINGRINNLFDKDFTKKVNYTADDGTLTNAYEYNMAQKRREFWVGINYTF